MARLPKLTPQEVSEFCKSGRIQARDLLLIPGVAEQLALRRLEHVEGVEIYEGAGDSVSPHTLTHNLNGLQSGDALWRPRLLFQPLLAIEYIRLNVQDLKLLIIGPRSEAELFIAYAHGFHPDNVEAIDLISYSEAITLGDMHALPWDDDTFDVVMAGWVLAYSHDNQLATREMLRVCKGGKYIAIGCVAEPLSLASSLADDDWLALAADKYCGGISMTSEDPERPGETKTVSRFFHSSQILHLFDNYIDAVNFREAPHPLLTEQRANLLVILRRTS